MESINVFAVDSNINTNQNLVEAYRWVAKLEVMKPEQGVDLGAFLPSLKNLIALLLMETMENRGLQPPQD